LSEQLHIVCLDAPSPPDYGGAIDMFYKIIALHAAGKKISLHYFQYKEGRSVSGLEQYCEQIHSYERKGFFSSLAFHQPYITRSRVNRDLIRRLNKDKHPVLLEGIHCAGVLPCLNDPSRAVVRMHNEEVAYYQQLANTETSLTREAYYRYEANRIKSFYKRLPRDTKLACLSETDMDTMQKQYGFSRAFFVPCFIPWDTITATEGKGDYCLYHGNMSVAENNAAAGWLIENVFSRLNLPFVIAGKDVSEDLISQSRHLPHVKIINDPPPDELEILIRDAHIHILPSLNETGVKLKLLHALYTGRFCVTNRNGAAGSRLENVVSIADTADEFIKIIGELYEMSFSEEHKKNRQVILPVYDNKINARKLNELW
jgi:hypothetical protein